MSSLVDEIYDTLTKKRERERDVERKWTGFPIGCGAWRKIFSLFFQQKRKRHHCGRKWGTPMKFNFTRTLIARFYKDCLYWMFIFLPSLSLSLSLSLILCASFFTWVPSESEKSVSVIFHTVIIFHVFQVQRLLTFDVQFESLSIWLNSLNFGINFRQSLSLLCD